MNVTLRRLALLMAQCMLLIGLMLASATAAYAQEQGSDLETVSADEVQSRLADDRRINLVNTKVEGDLQLYASQIDQFSAQNTVFDGDFNVDPCVEQHKGSCTEDVGRSNFDIWMSEFSGRVDFTDFYFPPDNAFGNLNFVSCEFKDEADFRSIGSPSVSFVDSAFDDDFLLTSANVDGVLVLTGVHFRGFADLSSVQFDNIRTYRIQADNPIYIRWHQFPDNWVSREINKFSNEKPSDIEKTYWPQLEATLLFWKNNFTELGFERDARTVNFEIIKARRNLESRSDIEGVMGRGDRWVARILSLATGFGSDPFRPLWVSLIAIPVFWLAYWLLGLKWKVFVQTKENPVREPEPLVAFTLLYSIDTFIPFITVTGVKEWGYATKGWSYWGIELWERLAGLYLFGAAAYSITSYAI